MPGRRARRSVRKSTSCSNARCSSSPLVAQNARNFVSAITPISVEVDEDLAAEELVHLFLARAVLARKAPKRADLVVRVVVDVHARKACEAVGEEVDQLLERALLLLAARRPERAEFRVGDHP